MNATREGRRRWGALLLGLCWCVPPVAGASGGAGMSAADITAITLERDCSGCATGTQLVLRRDGTALLTVTGKARLGTADSTTRGTLAVADFHALAQRLLAQGYFTMDDVYEEPGLQDGAWVSLVVVRAGQDKRVFRRDDAGPPALRALEAAIDALQPRITWAPAAR